MPQTHKCPHCGALYEVVYEKTISGDKRTANCVEEPVARPVAHAVTCAGSGTRSRMSEAARPDTRRRT